MRFFITFGCVFLLCALASPLYGEIYGWTDTKGIMHFTNYNPPSQAKLLIKDVRPPRYEDEEEQPAAEWREIEEEVEEKLDETIRRIEGFERNLEEAEILNQGLKRKLIEANQKADAALAYAEELEYNVREAATLPYSNTLYRNALYRFPIRYRYGYSYTIHKSRYRHKRFYTKRHSTGRHYQKFPKRSSHKSAINKSRFSIPRHVGGINTHQLGSRHISKPRSVGIQHNRQLGSRHVIKSHRVGVRSNARSGHRNIRK